MSWLDIGLLEYKRRLPGTALYMVECDFICKDEPSADSTNVTSVVEWWIEFFPSLDEFEPFMCLISHCINSTVSLYIGITQMLCIFIVAMHQESLSQHI